MSVGVDSINNSNTANMFLTKTPRNLAGVSRLIRKQAFSMSPASSPLKQEIKLPNLPVPKLSQTLEKFMKSVEPFLSQPELHQTQKLVQAFQAEGGLGPKLQKLLVEKAQNSDNWLADWWLSVAYLEYRDPVVLYSSPGLVFPFQQFICENERLEYAAKMVVAALAYKELIDSGKMPLEKMGKDPLDMNQYNKIFGTCRIPGPKRDHLEYNPQSRHIVVAKNNNYFKVPVINNEGRYPNASQIFDILLQIVEESEEAAPAIGVLTSDNRNNWGVNYQDLILDVNNLKSIREIQTSLFLLCLDNPMPNCIEDKRTNASHQLIHGGGSNGNAANRWYDKTVQFIVGTDGTNGLTYEHSPSEGQPIAVMTDFLINHIKSDEGDNAPDIVLEQPLEKLCFNVTKKIEIAIQTANTNIDKLAANLDMDSFQYPKYGKEFAKSQKLSPDSYIQVAMQYAFYRLHETPAAHYESAATRKYLHGRTETIRSCSTESVAFAEAMLDESKSASEKAAALFAAINAHKKYATEAVNGYGVDRHLLGLKLIALENGLEVPELYKDVGYVRSAHMRLSTSQVATKCDGFMCYGPLTVDGYGCCYNPRADDINFAVSAFVEDEGTAAKEFRKALEESLDDMRDVLACTQKSKL